MITLSHILRAQERIKPYVRRTAIIRNQTLSDLLGTNLYLKLELFQKTGSFKPRGALNKMLQMDAEEKKRGIVAISGGNFAQGVAYAGSLLDVRSLILMSDYTPTNYIEATKSYGADVELFPDFPSLFSAAEAYTKGGRVFFHPYDDPQVMEGYGTLGLEVVEDLPGLTDIILSVGGGGLMSGVTIAVKGLKPEVRIWTVETEGSETLGKALQAGKVVEIHPTSLARILGAPHVAEDALIIAQEHIEKHIIVSDQEAIEQQMYLLERAKILTELASSCILAAAHRIRDQFSDDDHVVLLLCGGNVAVDEMLTYQHLIK
ncbi:MAG: pyridoxal-5'-phosphate-dependent protein subunit beta [Chloroflexi bacterium RBG_16_48_8]|nr:MAG: pyridoxal-5'-phosphate-dependent protein subunit beta [Chloroflexi bacterium RBG_16_48_8]